MYTKEDMRAADAAVRRYVLLLALPLALLLAAYVAAGLLGNQGLMLAILLAAFWFASIEACLWLRPAVQYRNFLREMEKGLRRECICTTDHLNEKIQLQDGVRVHALQVCIDDGDTRIFYLNASKTAMFPPDGRKICITSFGRHVVEWRNIQ